MEDLPLPTFLGVLAEHAPELAAALVGALDTAMSEGVAELPRVGTLEPALVARGLYREALRGRPWAPLLAVDPERVEGIEALSRGASVASGGWMYVGDGWARTFDPAALRRLAASVGARLLLQGARVVGPVPPAAAARLAGLDALHAVATDPTLARARAALLAHCARAETVYLSGPVGSGRRALARWAHAVLDDRPLTVVAPGSPPEPGTWWLVPDVGELDPGALGPLRARLEAAEPMPVLTTTAGAGERPKSACFAHIVGRSEALCAVLREAERVAPSLVSVVILGESGTGKEPLAEAIHAASGRRGPLVTVDLTSRAPALVEDDLFGHVPHAFDGARTAREGAFKRSNRGTLFLDEIGNLSLPLQAKLLRVLERREVQPLGSDEAVPVDVRVIAATNVDLDGMVRLGEFRRDLFHRLAGKVLRLPPLRARPEDVPALARHVLGADGRARELGEAAREVLMRHAWPGNVRELLRVLENARNECPGGVVEPEHLGELAPSRARRAPLLVTGEPAALEQLELPRRQLRQLAALTLTLDGPADRGPACVRNAALHQLAGRVVTPDALRMLEAHPWWGGFVEMDRKLAALAALPAGVLDAERLVACLPELGQVSGWEPILVVQHPTVRDDTVVGLQASLPTAAVVIGRARRSADVDGPRAGWLRRLVGDASTAFLPFPHLGALSRAHVALTRLGDGLLAHRAPGARLEVRAGPVGGGAEAVVEGGVVSLGDAGFVQIVGDDGTPVVELYVFRGQVALRSAAPLLRVGDADPSATRHAGPPQRARPLEPEEADWLCAFVSDFVAGEAVFSSELRRSLPDAPTRWLPEYLGSANPPQSLKRLLEQRGNASVRARLRDALRSADRWERARERLPAQVWTVIQEDGEA